MIQTLTLASDSHEFVLAVIFGGMAFVFLIVLINMAIPAYVSMKSRREREQTKREIAAYVAEGSITPQEGMEMLRAVGEGEQPDGDAPHGGESNRK